MTTHEHQVLETAITTLHQTTGLRARVFPEIAGQDSAGEDAIIEVETNGHKYGFVAEVKTVDRFETPAIVKARVKDLRKRPLLVAPYITREIAARCRDLHLPFIDTAGNAYLEGPGLLIYVVGQPRPAELKTRPLSCAQPGRTTHYLRLALPPGTDSSQLSADRGGGKSGARNGRPSDERPRSARIPAP